MGTRAFVNYLKSTDALAVYKASVAGGQLVEHDGEYQKHQVNIGNAREFKHALSLDKEGFRLVESKTQVTDFYDDAQLQQYEAEIQALLKHETGAREIVIFDHTRRSASAAIRSAKKIREASTVIHNDYSAQSGFARLKDYLHSEQGWTIAGIHPESLGGAESRPFSIVNIWRSTRDPIANHALTMCHADSISMADLVDVKRVGKERVGEIQLLLYSSAHKWSYFPLMQFSESLIFKTFDSRDDGRARFTPHTAFEDPKAARDAPPRESIETRCFVFY